MTKVNESALTNWEEGQTMHSDDYERERTLIVAAINGTDAQVKDRYTKAEADGLLGTDFKGTWRGMTPAQAAEAINGARLDVLEGEQRIAHPSVTLGQGSQIINVPESGVLPFNVITIKGRTLVNLLGRDGNFENLAAWAANNGTAALDTTNFVHGQNGIKLTSSGTANTFVEKSIFALVNAAKYYIVVGSVKSGDGTPVDISVRLTGSATTEMISQASTDTTKFTTVYAKIKPSDMTGITNVFVRVNLRGPSAANKVGYADGLRFFEITQAEYDALADMTAEQIAAKYPYVDAMQSIDRVYITNKVAGQDDQYIYLSNMNAGSDPTGTVFDTVDVVNKRITRRLKTVELDGSQAWTMGGDKSGFKDVYVPNFLGNAVRNVGTAVLVKYDGKVTSQLAAGVGTSAGDQFVLNSDLALVISVADTDSGWGENYPPTADEIKAYFYGWKMSQSSTDSNALYTTGTKYWWPRTATGETTPYTTTLPTSMSTAGFKPYRLQYQLAQSVPENIDSEGAIALHEGPNQLEIGTGIVVREKANPSYDANSKAYNLNLFGHGALANSNMSNRVLQFVGIYKNGKPDKKWTVYGSGAGFTYGAVRATISEAEYDKSAVYEVTYLALDTYALGIAPQTIQAEYTPNIRETVDELAKRNAALQAQINVLETKKNYAVAAKVRHGLSQTLQHNQAPSLAFNTVDFDPQGSLRTGSNGQGQLVCRAAGTYYVQGQLQFAYNTTGMRHVSITSFTAKRGTTTEATTQMQAVNDGLGNVTRLGVSTLVKMEVGDYVEMGAMQTSGAALDVSGGLTYSPLFMMIKVGD